MQGVLNVAYCAHRDQIHQDFTSAFGAKRKWAGRQSSLPRSKTTLIDRLLRDFGATQHGQRAAILIFECSIN
jgi:hypothetical protein